MPATKEELEAQLAEARPIVKEATDLFAKRAAERTELEQIAPGLVDSLIKAGELDPTMREQAVHNLIESPVKVAMALKGVTDRLIDARNGIPPAPLGAGVSDPSRGTAKVANASDGKSKADEAFEAALGLN